VNIDDLIATAQPRTEVVRICARGDLVARHAEAVARLREATALDDSLSGSEETVAAAGEVVSIEAEMEASTLPFTVESVSRQVWADLLKQHPPSAEERRAGHDHNPETFPIAAIAACVSDPKLSVEKSQELAGVLHAGEWNKLWVTVIGLNVTGTPNPKLAAATDLLQANAPSLTTPLPAESLEDGSLAGSGEQ